MEESSLRGKKQKSALLTDRETEAQSLGASCLGLKAGCAQSWSRTGSHSVCMGLSCPSPALGVPVCPRESLFIVSIPRMEWGVGMEKREPSPLSP